MALVIEDQFLPATLSAPPMTDEEFERFCAEHPDLFFEMTAEGELIVMPPTDPETSMRNAEVQFQLSAWARKDRRGKVVEASGGFVLANGARRSPDASWISKSAIQNLQAKGGKHLWRLCPEFVIELRSPGDRLRKLRSKMREYIENGVQLGWLIDPENRSIEIYRPGRDPELRQEIDSIAGEGSVEGFVLDLRAIWEPLAE